MLGVVGGVLASSVLSFFAQATVIQSSVCDQIVTPSISSPVAGSEVESPVIISGTAGRGDAIVISTGPTPLTTVIADDSGFFLASVQIAPGSQSISVTATDVCNSQATSKPVRITVKSSPETPDAPSGGDSTSQNGGASSAYDILSRLRSQAKRVRSSIVAASDDSLDASHDTNSTGESSGGKTSGIYLPDVDSYRNITSSSIAIEGIVYPASVVKILKNGKVIAQTYQAVEAFLLSVPLDEGENRFVILARSENGVEQQREVVIYRTPTKNTQSEIAETSRFGFWWIPIVIGLLMVSGVVVLFIAKRRKRNDGSV